MICGGVSGSRRALFIRASVIALLLPVLLAAQAGAPSDRRSSPTATDQPTTGTVRGPAARTRVAIVVLENIGYSAVIGNRAAAPYINGLAQRYGLATKLYANTHPSMGNYFMMTTGQIISNDDAFAGTVADDNLAREITASGKSWKVYAQSLPSAGYTGESRGYYSKHHNPFAYFSDVVQTPQANNIVPLTQLADDLTAGSMPDFAFIIPDDAHNGHDCPGRLFFCTQEQRLEVADSWLQSLDPLLVSANFSNGVLVVTFDEADFDDSRHGGGHIAVVLAGDQIKGPVRSKAFMQHENVLRFVCDALQLRTCPGAGARASNAMGQLLQRQP